MKKRNFKHYYVIFLIAAGFVLLLINLCYAQPGPVARVHAPEPSSVALLSLGGIVGWMVRFARRRFREFKRMFDLVVGALGLVITFPIIALTAILIKIVSPGPIFFKQERVGRGGRIFNMYKIRTMRVDAEKETGPVWAQEDDQRLIKFAKAIRKMHIDELPQLFNVLKGDMSIIGPRPERPVFVKKLITEIPNYGKRHTIKPGITGLAQVWHKYDETIEDVKKKIKYDLLYIKKMCLLVDLRILFQTIIVAALGKGAR